MILPYLPRLAILSLALFFFVDLLLSAAVRVAARRMRLTEPKPDLLFWLRMLPALGATLTVAALCIPSYLELEPEATLERVGWIGLLAGLSGALLCCVSTCRAGRAILRSTAWIRHCERAGTETRLPGENFPVWLVDKPSPVFALVGIFRPRLVISRRVLEVLSPEQLTAVLKHEHGHWTAHDNFKRLLMLFAPGGSRQLEKAWTKQIEWAADDAVHDGLHLAEALVRVARIGGGPTSPVLCSSLIADETELSVRVDRLLQGKRGGECPPRPDRMVGLAALLGLPVAAGLCYTALPAVHEALEYLLR